MEEENLDLLVQWARFCVYEGEDDKVTEATLKKAVEVSAHVNSLCQSYEDTFKPRMEP